MKPPREREWHIQTLNELSIYYLHDGTNNVFREQIMRIVKNLNSIKIATSELRSLRTCQVLKTYTERIFFPKLKEKGNPEAGEKRVKNLSVNPRHDTLRTLYRMNE